MIRHLRHNLVAYLALIVALSTGSAYAAAQIANGSVTTKKLANNAVTSNKIKNGSIKGQDLRGNSVSTFTITDGSVTGNDIADGTVGSADIQNGAVASEDIKDDTIVRQDIQDAVVPQDADIIGSNVGAGNPPLATALPAGASGLNSFPFTLPRNAKLAIEFFAGELGVDCTAPAGQGQVGLYIDGVAKGGTLVDVPTSANAGAVQIVTNDFLNAGAHTLTTGEVCAAGSTYGPHVPAKRVTWSVHLLAR